MPAQSMSPNPGLILHLQETFSGVHTDSFEYGAKLSNFPVQTAHQLHIDGKRFLLFISHGNAATNSFYFPAESYP